MKKVGLAQSASWWRESVLTRSLSSLELCPIPMPGPNDTETGKRSPGQQNTGRPWCWRQRKCASYTWNKETLPGYLEKITRLELQP